MGGFLLFCLVFVSLFEILKQEDNNNNIIRNIIIYIFKVQDPWIFCLFSSYLIYLISLLLFLLFLINSSTLMKLYNV